MSEPRVRSGDYDAPPATELSEWARSRRRIHPAGPPRQRYSTEMSGMERRRLGIIGPTSRRRQRSESDEEEGARTNSPTGSEAPRRRIKRRRLQSPTPPKRRENILYGWHGQAEPGRLRLELVSCDGGEHRDPRNLATSLGPENVLRHDRSVYCSERKECSIVLRHADDNNFALEKLHIIAPEHGFTAPVRAGVVHVGMDMLALQRHVHSPARSPLQSGRPRWQRRAERSIQTSPERLSLADALRDPEVNAAFEHREFDYGRSVDSLHDLATARSEVAGDHESHCETNGNDDPDASQDSHDSRPVAVLYDDEPGPEDTSSQEVLDYRSQRARNVRRRYDFEALERDERWNRHGLPTVTGSNEQDRWNQTRLQALMARARVHDSAEADETTSHDEATVLNLLSQHGSLETVQDKEVKTAQFLLRRGQHRVTLKFDPPVSGRFILVNLWSGAENVDVQTIIASGFAGGRFFPATEAR